MDDETTKIYDAVGGDRPFYDLVDAFYQSVETDAVLRPLYPTDLTQPKEHLALFLIQRFGGHTAYSDRRGHPRLRMRHVPFRIGPAERDAWLRCMFAALDATPALGPFRDSLRRYFAESAEFLVNTDTIPAISFP
ncbi:MAG: globin [Armatimonadetes bacterium]|nr:globin [Armatimonadota bacterium]